MTSVFPASFGQYGVLTDAMLFPEGVHNAHHVAYNDDVEAFEEWGKDAKGYTTFTVGNVGQGAGTPNISKTTGLARYRRFGRLAHVQLNITLTGSGTAGNAMSIALPAPLTFTLYGAGTSLGQAYVVDTGTFGYAAFPTALDASTLTFISTSNMAYVGTAPSWALANTDIIVADFMAWIQ